MFLSSPALVRTETRTTSQCRGSVCSDPKAAMASLCLAAVWRCEACLGHVESGRNADCHCPSQFEASNLLSHKG